MIKSSVEKNYRYDIDNEFQDPYYFIVTMSGGIVIKSGVPPLVKCWSRFRTDN